MAHGKETPRQKMIGMMYLVLTAMLALNVSKEAVEAFKKVDEGLTKTVANYIKKNAGTYMEFDRAAAENPTKAGPYRDKAFELKERADEVFNYIHDLKVEIIQTAEGTDTEAIVDNVIDIHSVKKIDENNVPSEILIGSDQNGKANNLKALLIEYREFLLETIGGRNITAEESIRNSLNTDDPKNLEGATERWENANFQALPLVAVITILSKFQVDVRNAETEVLNFLYGQIDAASFKFNKLVPTVITNSNYIMAGNEYEAKVFIAATDTTKAPKTMIGSYRQVDLPGGGSTYEMVGDYTTLDIDESGRALYRVKTSSTGDKKWGGLIVMTAPDGTDVAYPFEAAYTVAVPNVVVSPTAMNVLYFGIDNPIDVSVPGVGSDKISVRMTNGTIPRGKFQNFRGDFIAKPAEVGKDAQIIVSADVNGRRMDFPPVVFRVRRIPDPVAKFGGLASGNIAKEAAMVAPGVVAALDNFEFDLKYEVNSYKMIYYAQGFANTLEARGPALTEPMKAAIRNLRNGQEFFFTEIRATGPDKITRDLPAIALTIR
ncbi:MAG: gliding motility protein GldM [Bacteroidales bacterium]|jgi:gliding motility-associated protein GldM|nr:gliding motility protein GldM [Bacteroidales bacterium]